jgi:hypothetical protein
MSQCTTVAPPFRDRNCMRVLILNFLRVFLSRCGYRGLSTGIWNDPDSENDLGKEKTSFKGQI